MFFVVGVQADGCFSALGFAVLNQIGADFVVNFFKTAAFKDAAVASPRDKLAVYLFKAVAFALTVAYVFFVFFNEIVGADAVEVAVLLGIFPGCLFEAFRVEFVTVLRLHFGGFLLNFVVKGFDFRFDFVFRPGFFFFFDIFAVVHGSSFLIKIYGKV